MLTQLRRALIGSPFSQLRSNLLPGAVRAALITTERLFPLAAKGDPFRLDRYFLVELPIARGHATGDRWTLAYAIKDALPDVEYVSVETFSSQYSPHSSRLKCVDPPGDLGWSIRAIRAEKAWSIPPRPGGALGGAGVRIGLLDTGYNVHRELDGILVGQGVDLLSPVKREPLDPYLAVDDIYQDHGTGVGSVLGSHGNILPTGTGRGGARSGTADAGPQSGIVGVAPEADILPIRCVDSVVTISKVSSVSVAKAIDTARHSGCDVISMSLGGLPAEYVHDALRSAVYASNLVAVAAAGNYYRRVVFPGAYDECLAVAGTTYEDKPWADSGSGPWVDIAAPAQCVWRAAFDGGREVVAPGVGTSFSAPHVSGTAALWLAFSDRTSLLTHYAASGHSLHFVFDEIAKITARKPTAWNSAKWGPGILDASAVLLTPLPHPSALGDPIKPIPTEIELMGRLLGLEDHDFLLALTVILKDWFIVPGMGLLEELAEIIFEDLWGEVEVLLSALEQGAKTSAIAAQNLLDEIAGLASSGSRKVSSILSELL